MLNETFPLRDTGYSNSQGSDEIPRHRWYFVKEAFSPYLVEKAIEDSHCGDSDIVIDPFSGSGTVPLTSSLKGHRSIALEVNPFLAFVSKTKLHQVRPKTLELSFNHIFTQSKIGKASPLEEFSSFSEAGKSTKWLFNRKVLRAFEGGWSATSKLYPPVRDLFRLALLGAAIDTCNAVRDGKCLRYKKEWQNLRYGRNEFLNAFEARINFIKSDLLESPNTNNRSSVYLGDARKLIGEKFVEGFKLCVTSPPYLNSFDYSDVYRPELFLGKFVESNEELRTIRRKTIRSHVQVNWEHPKENAFGAKYNESLNQITERSEYLWDRRIPIMIQAYFEDIERILRQLRKFAKPDASVWIVVATSAYVGIEIPVDLIIADIGSKVGWFLREVGVLRYLRSAGQHWGRWCQSNSDKPRLRESVVILDASPHLR